ncbi:MAG: P-loop NTPase [Oscillospiraceae bacterium]|jgi:septum site-determining protein MinD|nr:P-loop NTPase [Oscillospiraceae bacterium]
MAEKILVASGKGGVGKSTLAAFLGRELTLRGKKVLLVDTDVGLSALDLLLGVTERVVYNWQDVLKARCEPQDAVLIMDDKGLLSLLPAPLVFVNSLILPSEMKLLVAKYEPDYDYILIDAPAGLGPGVVMSSASADWAIVVATPDEVSVRGAFAVAEMLRAKGVRHARLVINRFRKKAVRQGSLLDYDSMIDKTGVRLIGIVPESADPSFAFALQIPLRAKNRALQAFRRIAARVDGENIPLGTL